MHEYDGIHHTPPAPVATVTVRHPGTNAVVQQVELFMDTGAAVTLLPQAVALQLVIC